MANDQPINERGARERRREYAIRNLKEPTLSNLTTAYLTQREDSGYGKNDNESVEEFLYFPTLNSGVNAYNLESGQKGDLMRNALLGSRQDERRYSGQISEYGIIKTSAAITQDSLRAVKVEDVLQLMGSNTSVGDGYSDTYISELLESENEDDQRVGSTLIAGYLQHLASKGVSNAISQRADKIRGGLEKLVSDKEE